MSPMRRCLTGPTQGPPSLMDDEATGLPWSPSKERRHHIRPDDWAHTWNQTERKTKNHRRTPDEWVFVNNASCVDS